MGGGTLKFNYILNIQSFVNIVIMYATLDVTVVSSLQTEMVKRAAEEVGSAAARRHKSTWCFFLVVVEVLGGWHEDAACVITRLARQLASHTGKEAERSSCLA